MTSRSLRVAIAIAAVATLTVRAAPAHAGDPDLDDATNAKLARIKAKQRQLEAAERRKGEKGTESPSAECGSIGIGNTVTNGRGRAPREVTVIVTGDVINANNRCR